LANAVSGVALFNYSTCNSILFANDTVAFNEEGNVYQHLFGGLFVYVGVVNLLSSIVTNNTFYYTQGDDIGGTPYGSLIGNHDMTQVTVGIAAPPGTLYADPLLAPLADNGGPTATHALTAGSPAIDAGSNTLSLAVDQRGSGYPREQGSAPDIGAFELAPDEIFANGFD
jgi:hypothetical protein